MNSWLTITPCRATTPASNKSASAPRTHNHSPRQLCRSARLPFSTQAAASLWRSLAPAPALRAAVILAVFTLPVRGQSTVTLAWDPSTSPGIAGYRLYQGNASQTYTNVIAAGNSTTATVSNLVGGATYYFAATTYDTNGLESAFSNEVSYNVPLPTNIPPTITLTSPSAGATYTAPATISVAASTVANGHTCTQVQFYNGTTLLGSVSSAPYTLSWNNVSAGSYSLSAKLLYDSGSSVASAPVSVTVTASPPASGLTFAATSGTYTSPFVASNGTLSQSVQTGVTNGGRAAYSFSITNTGKYLVSAAVIAPSGAQNSFYVNIDAEPTDPLMIWDIPPCTTLTTQTVSWRGNGNGDPASSQYIPKVFPLSAGTHQLIIRGREANTTLGTITISRRPARLGITTTTGLTGNLSGLVQPPTTSIVLNLDGDQDQTYSILRSQDLKTWTVIGTVTLDDNGLGQFSDPIVATRPMCFYMIQEQ